MFTSTGYLSSSAAWLQGTGPCKACTKGVAERHTPLGGSVSKPPLAVFNHRAARRSARSMHRIDFLQTAINLFIMKIPTVASTPA
jgi:hypothetical protein